MLFNQAYVYRVMPRCKGFSLHSNKVKIDLYERGSSLIKVGSEQVLSSIEIKNKFPHSPNKKNLSLKPLSFQAKLMKERKTHLS